MIEQEIEALAHRMAWRYAKSHDPNHSDTYTFNRQCLVQFAQALQAAERERCAKLETLLKRCRPIIEADAQMMADISRHAPLDADNQAQHDATEYESEKLARELERLLGPNSLSTNQPPATGKDPVCS